MILIKSHSSNNLKWTSRFNYRYIILKYMFQCIILYICIILFEQNTIVSWSKNLSLKINRILS